MHPDYPLNHLPAPSQFMPHGPYPYPGSFPYYSQHIGPAKQLPIEDLAVNDLTLFPIISNWLPGLDHGPRGINGHNFAQYVQYFDDNKIQHN